LSVVECFLNLLSVRAACQIMILTYGAYVESDLISVARRAKYGILLDRVEAQVGPVHSLRLGSVSFKKSIYTFTHDCEMMRSSA
jgi:hypothetical protein